MAGTCTEITIRAPSNAVEGSIVNVEVDVKNLHSTGITAWPAILKWNETTIRRYDAQENMQVAIPAGATHTWYGDPFVMPAYGITIHGESWYLGTDGNWHPDDAMDKDVVLDEAEAQFQYLSASYSKV